MRWIQKKIILACFVWSRALMSAYVVRHRWLLILDSFTYAVSFT